MGTNGGEQWAQTGAAPRRWDPWLYVIVGVSIAIDIWKLDWGLPNGNTSWAADALGPLTVLSIARHSIIPWNSGWFYFKYPLGYPLLLLILWAPYLGLQILTGHLRSPGAAYPYGFTHPDTALYLLALVGRGLSVACVAGTVALTYGIGRRLFGRVAGRLAAWFTATAYPFVYYAHTTNLDATHVFFIVLALWATVVAARTDARLPYALLGVAAAMAVSTKEQAFALFLPLPILVVAGRWRDLPATIFGARRYLAAVWNSGTRTAVASTIVTLVVANNVLLNPSGFVRRLIYLSGRPVAGVSARLAPVKFSLFKGVAKEWQYLCQLGDAVESSLGLPLCVLVVGGIAYVVWRRPRAAVFLLAPAVAQYYLSLRTLDLITLRYTLSLSVIGVLCAAALCADLLHRGRYRMLVGIAVGGVCALALARALELDLMLRDDARYQAEVWMRENMPAANVEIYQKGTYLPRFKGVAIHKVPLGERTIEGLAERHPGFIVTSSAA